MTPDRRFQIPQSVKTAVNIAWNLPPDAARGMGIGVREQLQRAGNGQYKEYWKHAFSGTGKWFGYAILGLTLSGFGALTSTYLVDAVGTSINSDFVGSTAEKIIGYPILMGEIGGAFASALWYPAKIGRRARLNQ